MPIGLGKGKRRLQIVISVQFKDVEGGTRTEQALIDSRAERNYV